MHVVAEVLQLAQLVEQHRVAEVQVGPGRIKMFYTIEMIPNKAYDGIIILKEATPTDVID